MKYKNIKIKEFSVEFGDDREKFDAWLLRSDIEIVDILTTPATSSHGFGYVIYSVIYR